jgi:3-(3-hydroxy-phenyl)propionate hydroxylase
LQDTDNLAWKLKLVIEGKADEALLDSYSDERVHGAEENILNSTRSTDFITPKSKASRTFRDAVLALARHHEFARPLVNSGRLSVPCTYDDSALNGPDMAQFPADTRPGAPMKDADTGEGWLLDRLGNCFQLLAINIEVPAALEVDGIKIEGLNLPATDDLKTRYLGDTGTAVYLLRPDQHVAARWLAYDESAVQAALRNAIGKG